MDIKQLIDELVEKRKAPRSKLDELLGAAKTANRGMTDAETAEFDTAEAEVKKIDERLEELRDQLARDTIADDLGKKHPRIQVVREPMTYGKGSGRSFFADVYKASVNADAEARDRLSRHGKEQKDELEERRHIAERRADELREQGVFRNGNRDIEFEKRDITRVDGAGGEFVPPLWLVDEYAPLARAARVFADSFNVRPLPAGTDSINIPRITTGASAAIQTADNAAVAEQDIVSATLTVPVRTIAGQQDIAIQLLEQSPIAFDEVVFSDLIADYNASLDAQLIDGSGSSGQIQGLLGLSGINAVTYTDASPTVPELYPKLADGVNQAATNRKLPPTRIFMSPRRWYWHTAALDSQNRPLVVPIAQGPNNTFGRVDDVQTEGPVGMLQGLPVYIDPNMPENKGGGTNEDRVVISRFLDHWLWESFLRTRVLPDVLSGNLTVRLQVYSYAAGTAGRYPKATSVVSGTGLVTPTF